MNKIEHRMLSFISLNWKGEPLVSLETVVNLISGTTTRAGLKIKARLDKRYYETGIEISDEEMEKLNRKRQRGCTLRSRATAVRMGDGVMKQNNRQAVERRKEIAALIAAYRASGLGLGRFAHENRISPNRLHYWIYQKSQDSKPNSLDNGARAVRAPVFQEVKLGVGSSFLESWAAEIRLAGGVTARFSGTAVPPR
jgi:hypothetical protein